MIFVTLGSQKFQFNRLLKEIDELIEKGEIKEEVFAQIGYSDYKPKNYKFKEFLDRDEFTKNMKLCRVVLTHGGTGAIISAIKQNKQVIAVARLEKYNEHVDNHQLQIIKEFKNLNYIEEANEIKLLINKLNNLENKKFDKYASNTYEVIKNICSFIEST